MCPERVRTSVAAVEVEHLEGLVGRGGDDLAAVGAEGDGEDRPGMPGEDAQGRRGPDAHLVVEPRRDDRAAVGRDGHALHRRAVGREELQLAAVGGVPGADGVVGAAGGDAQVVVGEPDRLHRPRVAGEVRDRLAVADRPELRRLVGRAGDEPLAVPGEDQGQDGVGVAGEVADGLAVGDRPELRRLVGRGRGDHVAVGRRRRPGRESSPAWPGRALASLPSATLKTWIDVVLARRRDLAAVVPDGEGRDRAPGSPRSS